MFEIGPEKLLIMLVICLVLFGGKRIPEIGGAIGKGIREFKKGVSDMGDSLHSSSSLSVPASSPAIPVKENASATDAAALSGREPRRLLDGSPRDHEIDAG
jgi:sec-independent protein translocase protein TatA